MSSVIVEPGHVEVQRVVRASPDALYAMVSDVTRMGEWSPETTSCRWLGGATLPQTGARFLGVNKQGWHVWATVCKVTDATPGRRFAFDAWLGLPIANWSFRFEPHEDGTLVTQGWTDQRGFLFDRFGWLAHGVKDRPAHNAAGMEATLDRLALAAEAAA